MIKHSELKNGNMSSEYIAWQNAIGRINNKNNPVWNNYGGRGIKMCDRWRNSFLNFINDMGRKPTKYHTLERYNVNKDYSPDNCGWELRYTQSINRRKLKSKVGITGVYIQGNSYMARINTFSNGKITKCFKTLEEAISQRKEWELQYYKPFVKNYGTDT